MPLIPGTSTQPRVILGLMTFGEDTSAGGRITTQEEFQSCLSTLQNAGYNELDTARVYVNSTQEAWSAKAGVFEKGFSVATKIYPAGGLTHSPEDLRKTLDTSLKELGVSCVDIWYLHAPDRTIPFETTLAEVDKLHKEGKFVRLGLSNFTSFEVAEVALLCRQHGWVRPSIWQGMYNAITRNIETELIPACRRYGLDVVCYNPIAGGLLSGKYSAEHFKEPPKEGRYSDANGIMGQRYRERYFRDTTFESIKLVEDACKANGLTMLETAFRWIVHHSQLKWAKDGGNDGILIGVSSEAQLKSNLENIAKGPLPDEVVEALDQAWKISKPESVHYWHMELKYGYDTEKALFG